MEVLSCQVYFIKKLHLFDDSSVLFCICVMPQTASIACCIEKCPACSHIKNSTLILFLEMFAFLWLARLPTSCQHNTGHTVHWDSQLYAFQCVILVIFGEKLLYVPDSLFKNGPFFPPLNNLVFSQESRIL